jgi:hypothetical protein
MNPCLMLLTLLFSTLLLLSSLSAQSLKFEYSEDDDEIESVDEDDDDDESDKKKKHTFELDTKKDAFPTTIPRAKNAAQNFATSGIAT